MKKKKILMLSDLPVATSGVGTQSRWLIEGLVATGKYSFRCFGGAVKHENYNTIKVNDDFIIKPTDGFGTKDMLRQVLATERPDALLLFTDPRFFIWVWEMEDEVHQICPIAYNHLWDNPPWPDFNRILYESTDLINCINWPTYEMVKERFPEKTNYIPHAVPENLYKPLSEAEVKAAKLQFLGKDKLDHTIYLYVSRNARRKATNDILVSWNQFINDETKRTGKEVKATLVMHTDPLDPEGPNLHHTLDMLNCRNSVLFSKDRIQFEHMSLLYNISDVVINRSINEGFGLSTLEGMQCGKPIISIKTGGLTRQVVNYKTGEENGIGLEPDVRCLTGNQLVPYIYEDYITHEKLATAFSDFYNWSPEKKKEVGDRARKYALEEYSMSNLITEWDRTLTGLIEKWSGSSRNDRWSAVGILI